MKLLTTNSHEVGPSNLCAVRYCGVLYLQDLMKKPVGGKNGMPFRSVSAVLQEHVNPEHAAHFAAVNAGKDAGAFAGDAPGDLPSSKPAPAEK